MLNALLHSGVGDVVAVVTRYYGGTKLGTGGLVRAYGGGVQQALAGLPLAERIEYVGMCLVTGYASLSTLLQLFPIYGVETLGQVFDTDVRLDLRVPQPRVQAFRTAVANATSGQALLTSN
jgi:putative IMPACT (imprinted ancient) family translation regulator